MRAEDVGWSTNQLVLGKHSGRTAFKQRLADLGIKIDTEEALNAAFREFKDLADKKHEIFDEDLMMLATDNVRGETAEKYKLLSMKVLTETGEVPIARLVLSIDGREKSSEASGSGPIDATFKAIEVVLSSGADLELYSVNAITRGTDSQGEVGVRLSKSGRVVNGQGADTDIIVASAKAYLDALNKLGAGMDRINPQS